MPRITKKPAPSDDEKPVSARKRRPRKKISVAPPPAEEVEQLTELLASTPSEPVVEDDVPRVLKKVKAVGEKKTRAPSAYNLFCKQELAKEEIKKLPNKDRFREVSKRWAAHKAATA